MAKTRHYTIFDHHELTEKEADIDKAITASERESQQMILFDSDRNTDNDLNYAVKWHSWKLRDELLWRSRNPDDVPADKYIGVLQKYAKAFGLVTNPYNSIDIEMRIKDNVHKIWKDLSWVAEQLPQELERFGLVHDYPSDLINRYGEVKDRNPESLAESQTINLERAWWGSFHVYLDYFGDLDHRGEYSQRPDSIMDDYEEICNDPTKFGRVVDSMHGSLRYACYLSPDTLKWKIGTIVESALSKRQDFVDQIPSELSELVDEQIMFLVEHRNKTLGNDEIIYGVPESYRNQNFLEAVDQALVDGKLRDEDFFNWMLNRAGYERKQEEKPEEKGKGTNRILKFFKGS